MVKLLYILERLNIPKPMTQNNYDYDKVFDKIVDATKLEETMQQII